MCLHCADLDHLVFLPSGDAAPQQAEQECFADAEARARRKEREAARRAELDQEYIQRFAAREQIIAEHACLKYSGRVGRSASAKALDLATIILAVVAHIRHAETSYDHLLSEGMDRFQARDEIKEQIQNVFAAWKK